MTVRQLFVCLREPPDEDSSMPSGVQQGSGQLAVSPWAQTPGALPWSERPHPSGWSLWTSAHLGTPQGPEVLMVTAPERLLDSRTRQAGTLVPAFSSPRTIPAGQRSWLHSSHWVSVGAGCWQQEPEWGGSACGWEPEA